MVSCSNPSKRVSNDQWFSETTQEILAQSNITADSVTNTYNADSSLRWEHHFSKGRKFLTRHHHNSGFVLEIYFSADGLFELRRELCKTGKPGFEGIFYKNKSYGISSWTNCNGRLQELGVRFNGERIGIWKKWSESGNLIAEFNYNKTEYLDSMPAIKRMEQKL